MEKIVTNCKDCVFNTYGKDDTPYCKLDEGCRDLITDKTGYYATDEIPLWCPIRCDGILIKLKQANVSGSEA